ncbi:MAG TPA: hypothetical protein VF056_00480, partial [Thermoleophilaceae bacterium]
MAPFHPLQNGARAFAARALAALAVFCTIAVVLLAGSSRGSVANAEAKNDNGNGNGQQVADPGAVPNGVGNGLTNGGGGKSDPPDPQEPAEPPTVSAPVPA